jgi:putative phage-type endonuclease
MTDQTLPDPNPDFARRRLGVSASQIAAVMGLSRYEDAFTVYQKKVHELDDKVPPGVVDVSPMRWGRAAEGELLLAYSEIMRVEIVRPGTVAHKERDWQMATPDGIVKGKPLGVECKTADSRLSDQWGNPEDESDRVPTEYFLQCQYGMSVMDYDEWDLPVLIGGNDFRINHLRRDREMEEMMLEGAWDFISKHLRPRIPPPVGWSPASTEWIKRQYPEHRRPVFTSVDDDSETYEMAARLYGLTQLQTIVERRVEEAKNRLKVTIGDAEGIEHPEFRISWKRTKDRESTDWQGLAGDYEGTLRLVAETVNDEGIRMAIIEALQSGPKNRKKSSPGWRVFRPTWHPLKKLNTLSRSVLISAAPQLEEEGVTK